MNEIENKFLQTGDKFMPEMHLKQPGFLRMFVVHLLKNWRVYAVKKNRLYLQKQ